MFLCERECVLDVDSGGRGSRASAATRKVGGMVMEVCVCECVCFCVRECVLDVESNSRGSRASTQGQRRWVT